MRLKERRKKRSLLFGTVATAFLVQALWGAGMTFASAKSSEHTGTPGGEVVVYSAGPPKLAKALAKEFTKKTGIHVELFQSTTGKILGRLQAEKANPQADVVALADWSAANSLASQGELKSFRPKDANKLIWTDPQDQYFAYSASALGITYNTHEVKVPPKSWSIAALAIWHNKIVMPDPAQSGSAIDFVGGYLQKHANGWAEMQKFSRNGLVVDGPNAQALDQVLIGAKAMVLAGVDYMAYADRAKGEPINIAYPASGTVVNPRPVMVLKGAKHLAAAEAFVNFLLSREGQKTVAQNYLLPGRKDVPSSSKRLSLARIKDWKVNWLELAKDKKRILTRFESMFGR